MDGDRIGLDNPAPLHQQVAGAIRRAVAEGQAGPGGRLTDPIIEGLS